MTTPCEVKLLGKFTVTFADGREPLTQFRTRKVALLLAYLALHQGKAQTREFLIELLWPESELTAGRNSLNNALSTLRRQLDADIVEADSTTLCLRAEGVRVDVRHFEVLVRRGLLRGLPEAERAALLQEALAFWEPPLLGIYDDWAVMEQERLEALAGQARQALEALPPAPLPLDALPTERDALPVTFSRYFGSVETVASLLESARLLTLLGPGGVGKTRLSLEVARASIEQFAKVVFVSLAELPLPALVLPTLRRRFTSAPPGDDPLAELEGLIAHISGRVLVLLDNVEHLLPQESDNDDEEKSRFGIPRVVRQLLERCPNLTVLATSRQALGVEAEQLYSVPLLPPEVATALFVDRARSVRPDFVLTDANAGEVTGICSLLEGLPLAIELATVWVRGLSLAELRGRLERELLWLEGRRRDLSPRQKSLEATLRWSWQLLSPEEKRLFAALSVFRGGWSLEAAEAVEPEALETLFALIDKSLVLVEHVPIGTRYRFLEPVRRFAQERLDESGAGQIIGERHLRHFCRVAEEAEKSLTGREQARWLTQLDQETDNLRTALEFSLTQGDVEVGQALGGALWQYWRIRCQLSEGRLWYQRLLEHPTGQAGTLARASVLHGAGALANMQTDYDAADRDNSEALRLRREHGDRRAMASSLNSLGNTASYRGDFALARAFHEEGLAIKREIGDLVGIGVTLNNLGTIALSQSDYAGAQRYHEESLAIKRQRGDENGIAASLTNLGSVFQLQGELARARHYFAAALEIRWRLRDQLGVVVALESLAANAAGEAAWLEAVVLFGAADGLHHVGGSQVHLSVREGYQSHLNQLREALAPAEYEAAWQEGHGLTLDEAVARALSTVS